MARTSRTHSSSRSAGKSYSIEEVREGGKKKKGEWLYLCFYLQFSERRKGSVEIKGGKSVIPRRAPGKDSRKSGDKPLLVDSEPVHSQVTLPCTMLTIMQMVGKMAVWGDGGAHT